MGKKRYPLGKDGSTIRDLGKSSLLKDSEKEAKFEDPLGRVRKYKNIEEDDKQETKLVLEALSEADREHLAANKKKGKDGDSLNAKLQGNGFWICLVFVSKDQCHEFLSKSGWSNCL